MNSGLAYRIEQLRLQQNIRHDISEADAIRLLKLRAEHGPLSRKARNKRRAAAREENRRLIRRKYNQARRAAQLGRKYEREERMQGQRMVTHPQRIESGEPLLHIALESYALL